METPDRHPALGGAHLDGGVAVVVYLALEHLGGVVRGGAAAGAVLGVGRGVPPDVAGAGAGRRLAPALPVAECVHSLFELDHLAVARRAVSAGWVAEVVGGPLRQARVMLPGRVADPWRHIAGHFLGGQALRVHRAVWRREVRL